MAQRNFEVIEGMEIARRTSDMLSRCTRSIKAMQFIIRDVRRVKRSRFDPAHVSLNLFQTIASKVNRGAQAQLLIRLERKRYSPKTESYQEIVARQLKDLEPRIQMRLCPQVHQKILITDDDEAWLGSANMNYRGMGGKRDLILWTNDKYVVGRLCQIFDRRWAQADEICNYCVRGCTTLF